MGVVEDAGKIAGKLRARADAVQTDAQNTMRDGTPKPAPKPAPVHDTGRRYGDAAGAKQGETRIDVTDALKPLGGAKPLNSFKHGTDYVPKTGIYKLHEGEAVKTKEENTMNAASAMAGITKADAKPPKKIHEIRTRKTDNGKYIHTHLHHHPNHHPDETHVSDNADTHMAAMAPEMSAQPPAMPEAGAPPAGAPPAMPGM